MPPGRVSILVFVELALDGCDIIYFLSAIQVSILVFVELALDGQLMCYHPHEISLFQSLFSWNLLLM